MKKFIAITSILLLTLIVSAVFSQMIEPVVSGAVMMGGGAMFSTDRHRAIFKSLSKKYNTAPSPSYLRVEQTLSNSKGTYQFDVKKLGSEVATEVKLDRNDLFVCTDMMFYLLDEVTAEIGVSPLQTYPNQTEFASATSFTPTDLLAIYSGYYTLKIGKTVNIENLSMQHFLYIPQTQQSASTNYSQYNVGDVVYPLGSLMFLNGTADIKNEVTFPTFSGIQIAAVASGHLNKLVFHPYGYLLKGKAQDMK